MEQELCICFLENIIVQAKKAINRHAKELMDNEAFEGQLPTWATKYREAGIWNIIGASVEKQKRGEVCTPLIVLVVRNAIPR